MEAEQCPFLVAVMADPLWPRPVSDYCRRPDGRLRVPAPVRVACICMTPAHLVCAGYLASAGGGLDGPLPNLPEETAAAAKPRLGAERSDGCGQD
jgi:hypothetical protein